MTVLSKTQQVYLHGDIKSFKALTQPGIVFAVGFVIAGKMEQVRVCSVLVSAGFQGFNDQIGVPGEHILRGGRVSGVSAEGFGFEEMLTEYHVVNRVVSEEFVLFGHKFGDILRLEADVNGDIVLVLVTQVAEGLEVAVQFMRFHASAGNEAIRENPRAVVGESEDFYSLADSRFHIFPVFAGSMAASCGMCMIISVHHLNAPPI